MENKLIRLSRELSKEEIFNQVLDVQIEALNNFLRDYWAADEWTEMLSLIEWDADEVKSSARLLIDQFTQLRNLDNPLESEQIRSMDPKWFNTLKYILFTMEEELYLSSNSFGGVIELWQKLFSIEETKTRHFGLTLNIKDIIKNGKNT